MTTDSSEGCIPLASSGSGQQGARCVGSGEGGYSPTLPSDHCCSLKHAAPGGRAAPSVGPPCPHPLAAGPGGSVPAVLAPRTPLWMPHGTGPLFGGAGFPLIWMREPRCPEPGDNLDSSKGLTSRGSGQPPVGLWVVHSLVALSAASGQWRCTR